MLRVPILILLLGLCGCSAMKMQSCCQAQSERDLETASRLVNTPKSAQRWDEAQRLALRSAQCGNPKAPMSLASLYAFSPRKKPVEAYGWLGVVVDRNLEDKAKFAERFRLEIARSMSKQDIAAGKARTAEHLASFGSNTRQCLAFRAVAPLRAQPVRKSAGRP
jgi:hypothetical protein